MRTTILIEKVDYFLKQLRDHLLGLDINFSRLLPDSLSGADAATKASFLARQISFILARKTDATICLNLSEHGHFLEEMIRYILLEVGERHHNFANLITLTNTSVQTRKYLLPQAKQAASYQVLNQFEPADTFSALLEEAAIELMNRDRLKEQFALCKEVLRESIRL